MGNLAEHYELSSMKSAGISLWRIMIPLMIVALLISCFSMLSSNYIMPVCNLKYKSKLYDIRKQKPALSLEEGIFNDDFQNIIIQFDEKTDDGNKLKNIKIYDHKNDKGRYSAILARSGEFITSSDHQFMVMKLNHGNHYQETTKTNMKAGDPFPFIRTKFDEWNKVLDLSEFNMNMTNEESFKSHRTMLSAGQLIASFDTLDMVYHKRLKKLNDYSNSFFKFIEPKTETLEAGKTEDLNSGTLKRGISTADSILLAQAKANAGLNLPKPAKRHTFKNQKLSEPKRNPIKQVIDKPLKDYNHFDELFPGGKLREMFNNGKQTSKAMTGQLRNTNKSLKRTREDIIKHQYEFHNRFSMALICFVFLFIGAPMGAIVRKGGFGYPILISIIFFMVYVVIRMSFENMAEEFVITAPFAAWLPFIIMFPIGLILTIKAMNDSKLLNVDDYINSIKKLFAFFAKAKQDKQVSS